MHLHPRVARITLSRCLRPGTVEHRTIDHAPQEFPTIDGRRTGLPYRFAYALGLPEELSETLVGESPLLKHDLERGTRHVHDFGPGRVAGEFVFVPRAQGTAEDDGWLVGFVINAADGGTALEILDAANIEVGPVAAILVPHRIPPGIHGAWLPTQHSS